MLVFLKDLSISSLMTCYIPAICIRSKKNNPLLFSTKNI